MDSLSVHFQHPPLKTGCPCTVHAQRVAEGCFPLQMGNLFSALRLIRFISPVPLCSEFLRGDEMNRGRPLARSDRSWHGCQRPEPAGGSLGGAFCNESKRMVK